MMNLEELQAWGYRGGLSTARAVREQYAGAAGVLHALPAAVATPLDAADIALLTRWCAETRTPLIPRGAGTGMPGGNIGPGLIVDLFGNFRHTQCIDAERRLARVSPGVTLGELNAAAAPVGLHFPVDPSSGARCSLGGMIANNAAGARSVRYGATRAWVDALEVVLADGSRTELRRGEPVASANLRHILARLDAALEPDRVPIAQEWPRVRKNSSGYALREYLASGDAVDLVVGSEGTLALVTAAELRLEPLPAARGLALLEFTDLVAAGAAVTRVLQLGPTTCEILDRTFLELVRDAGADAGYPLRPGLEAILLVEVQTDDPDDLQPALARVQDGVAEIAHHVTLATDPARQARMWDVRKAASPLIARRTDGRVSMQFIEDGVVPLDKLPHYILALRHVLAEHDVPAVIFGHAGDGNLHVNPLVAVAAPRWRDTVEQILFAVAAEVKALGGTLAGEHGDGRLRAPLLEMIWGAPMVARFRHLKELFDPLGILNPGVILPLPGQRPLDCLPAFAASATVSGSPLAD
jgi:FAD/FMN-containing dehydrogenase